METEERINRPDDRDFQTRLFTPPGAVLAVNLFCHQFYHTTVTMAAEEDTEFLDMLCDLMEDDDDEVDAPEPVKAAKPTVRPPTSTTIVASKPSGRKLSTAPSIQQTAKRKASVTPEVVKVVCPCLKK